jgi:hypothetical protein
MQPVPDPDTAGSGEKRLMGSMKSSWFRDR